MKQKSLVPLLGAALFLGLTPAAPALADETVTVSQPASTSDTGAWATVSVPVAKGLTPSALTGRISTTASDGQLQLRVGQNTVKTLPVSQAGTFEVPLTGKEPVEQGALNVSVRWQPETRQGQCLSSEPQEVQLSEVALDLKGQATAPKSIAEFFAGSPKTVSVYAADEAAAAALSAVPALAAAFPNAEVSWNAKGADYTIEVALADEGMQLTLDQSGTALRLSGSAEQLANLDTVIRSQAVTLATGRQVDALATPATETRWAPAQVLSLADLGSPEPKLEGYGQSSVYIGVDEANLGSSLEGARLHLSGTHSAIPENTAAALNVYWNDTLVDSFVLGEDTTVDADIQIPDSLVNSRNGLRLQLDAAAQGANCAVPGALPVQLHLDGAKSTLTPQYGAGNTSGFQMLPQRAGGELGLALGQNVSAATANELATSVLAALQQSSAVPLKVENLQIADVASSPLSTVVIGADATLADELGAPLRLERFRTIESSVLEAGVGSDTPYAALEAFEHDGRTVLLAGSWSPDGTSPDELYQDLATQVTPQAGGWAALSRNLLIAQDSAKPVLLESNALIPQKSVTDDYRAYAWWAVGGVIAVILAGVAGTLAYRRRNARAKAQATAEAQAANGSTDASSSALDEH